MKAIMLLSFILGIVLVLLPVPTRGAEGGGLDSGMGNLFRVSKAKSRSISPENFTGEKGKAAMATTNGSAWNAARELGQGWKVSPYIRIASKTTFTLAEIKGPGSIQQIWMTPTGNWRNSILRFYWDDEATPSIEVPVGDFFACGWGKYSQVSSLAVCVNPGSAFNCYQAMAGETDAAIEGLKTAVALDPGKALYHHGLGSVYARAFEASRDKQAFQLAYAEFRRAIELYPLDSRLLGLLGRLYVSAAQVPAASTASDDQQKVWLRAAVQVYERAIRLAPFSAMYRYEQARLYWMLGARSDAERRAAEAENLEPNFLPARALLARLWIEEGQVDQARGQLREILARQARYREWSKTSLDQVFLNVDVAPLRAAVGEKAVAGRFQ